MLIKSETKSAYRLLNDKSGWLQRIAEYLLSLPRGVKRGILLSIDFALSLICLFLLFFIRWIQVRGATRFNEA